ESAKGFALLLILFFWRHQIDSVLDGIIYGAMVGMGFAMVENIFYFVQFFEEISTLFVLRAIIFGLNHSLFSSLTGLGIAIARLSTNQGARIVAPILGWSGAVFLHFVHNGLSSFGGAISDLVCIPLFLNAWGGVIVLVLIIIWALVQERQWLKKYLAEEVARGTITTRQYEIAASTTGRFSHNFGLLTSGQFNRWSKSREFFTQSSRLAYANHHFEMYSDEGSQTRLESLRHEVHQIGKTLL
ncbi:MAG: PrsW family intramembrane metalloprotease, partial [Chloroflexota bacterium]